MHENSLTEGLSDSQQAKLFRTLLLQMDREDITFKNLGGGQLSSRDLVVKLQTLTGIKAGPKVSALAPSPRREAVRWPSQAGRTPLALDTIGKYRLWSFSAVTSISATCPGRNRSTPCLTSRSSSRRQQTSS
jgi:hypothetical protein